MTKQNALQLEQVTVGLASGRDILHNINITVPQGECHVIMGPNGAGKSSLLHAIMGLSPYALRTGTLHLQGSLINAMPVEERVSSGLFMSFQSPVAIPGVSTIAFYKAMVQQQRHAQGLGPLPAGELLAWVKECCRQVDLPESFLRRDINDDFSGGERKRNELVQMLLLQPAMVMLDEVDSGVDVDAMENFTHTIRTQRQNHGTSFLVVTHYQRFLETLDVDRVHVIVQGKKVASGTAEIMREVHTHGFKEWA